MIVGVLALQGCVEPHLRMCARLGVEAVPVRSRRELEGVERLIIPGGESTTMLHLLLVSNLFEPLADFCQQRPVLGVCAGAILLANEVVSPTNSSRAQRSLRAIPLRAHRNFYGGQLESFEGTVTVVGDPNQHQVQFIRAPLLEPLDDSVATTGFLGKDGVLFCYRNVLAASFHSELGSDTFLHQQLIELPERRKGDLA